MPVPAKVVQADPEEAGHHVTERAFAEKRAPMRARFRGAPQDLLVAGRSARLARRAAAFREQGNFTAKGPLMRASSLSDWPDGLVQRPVCRLRPVTDRSQPDAAFSPQQMNQLGADSFTQMKQQEKVSKDARMNAYVGCVAKAVTAQVPASYGITSWEVVVFDSQGDQRLRPAGGKIGVYSGLLKVAKNQDQLATVIGHELTHVLAQHSNERLSRDQLTGIGLAVADAAIGSSDRGRCPGPPWASGSRWG